ncbi:hypothetical protein DBV15_01761 [Temnothorax longispinosus]|uniref:Uncharacterized protein n=1 Tax=Temnothorax longispinosus TaxID=300112 RepID=A0A4S2KN52_9HYME|nr:hypothetical protein DBV15_01761 [Temnothorax longispinosus]
MIHRVYEKSGQNKEEGDKNQTGSQGEGWIRPLDSRCAMNSPEFFLAGERKDSGDVPAVPSLGIKRVLSSRGCGVVVTARLYTAVFDSWRSIIPFLSGPPARLSASPKIAAGNLTRWQIGEKVELLEFGDLENLEKKTPKFRNSENTQNFILIAPRC